MGQQRFVVTQIQPEILAAALGGADLPAGQPAGEVELAGEVAAYRTGMAHLDRGHRAPGDVFGEAEPDNLDLG
jgi:hypothetical protein